MADETAITRERAIMRVPTPAEGDDRERAEIVLSDDQILVPLRPIVEILGLDWPNARERIAVRNHSKTPIPRERAIVRVPPAQESGDQVPVPVALAEEESATCLCARSWRY